MVSEKTAYEALEERVIALEKKVGQAKSTCNPVKTALLRAKERMLEEAMVIEGDHYSEYHLSKNAGIYTCAAIIDDMLTENCDELR